MGLNNVKHERKAANMITLGDIKKINELSDKILTLFEDKDKITQSDLQGAIEAVLLNAIQYGKGGNK